MRKWGRGGREGGAGGNLLEQDKISARNKGEDTSFETPPNSLLPTQKQYGLVSTIWVYIINFNL